MTKSDTMPTPPATAISSALLWPKNTMDEGLRVKKTKNPPTRKNSGPTPFIERWCMVRQKRSKYILLPFYNRHFHDFASALKWNRNTNPQAHRLLTIINCMCYAKSARKPIEDFYDSAPVHARQNIPSGLTRLNKRFLTPMTQSMKKPQP